MRKIYLLLPVLILLLAACGSTSDAPAQLPDLLPTLAVIEDSPRVVETPDPGLPPTWTPVPQEDTGHLVNTGSGGSGSTSAPPPIVGTRFIYVVARGDSLGTIATRYGVSVSDLAALNNIEDINRIEVGQELVIPIEGQ